LPRSYKLKIVIGGSAGSGKSSFLLGKNQLETDFNHLGVSFKPIEVLINESDSYKFIVWDLKVKERFKFLYPIFCRGAAGAFLCVDVSDPKSFEEIPYWVKVFRENKREDNGSFPIVLICTKTDLNIYSVSMEDINQIVKEYELDGSFFISIYDDDKKKKKEIIFKHFIEKIEPFYQINECSIFVPKEDEAFKEFVKFFSICPICNRDNHFESLKSFYYTREQSSIILKEKLFELMDASKDFDNLYYNKIRLGIPCCSCFKKFFEKKTV
jgi:GTPase SAR1 family protein